MVGDARIFLEKDGEKKEVQAVKRVVGGSVVFWLNEITQPQPHQPTQEGEGAVLQTPQQHQDEGVDQPTPEVEVVTSPIAELPE